MLNLSQIRSQVKQVPANAPIINTLNLTGLSLTYRELKNLGWQSTGQVHPTNRTSTLTLGAATLHSLHNQGKNRTWCIEIDGQAHEITGSAAEVTAAALDLQPAPEPVEALTPAEVVAADLTAEYPDYAKRIEAGLALFQSDTRSNYDTRYYPATDQIKCDCPDATHRRPAAFFGAACKHAVAFYIRLELSRQADATAIRKTLDRQERRRRDTALPAHVDYTDRIEDWLGYEDKPAPRLSDLKVPANAEAMLAKTRQQNAVSAARIASALATDTESLKRIYTGPQSLRREG